MFTMYMWNYRYKSLICIPYISSIFPWVVHHVGRTPQVNGPMHNPSGHGDPVSVWDGNMEIHDNFYGKHRVFLVIYSGYLANFYKNQFGFVSEYIYIIYISSIPKSPWFIVVSPSGNLGPQFWTNHGFESTHLGMAYDWVYHMM